MLNNTEELAFFHDATVIICGTPDTHAMLKKVMEFLRNFIPLDALALSCFEPHISAVRRLAMYHKNGDYEEESLEHIPEAPLRFALSMIQNKHGAVLTNYATANPIRAFMNTCGKSPYQSAIVLHLYDEDNYIGFVDIFGKKAQQFTVAHCDLVNQLVKPFSLYMINVLHTRELQEKSASSPQERVKSVPLPEVNGTPLVGFSTSLAYVRQLADDVARTATPVLLTGETGTGKDMLAAYIQQRSSRAGKPFIKVNCAAIPEALFENEFFGHDSSAFTGAKNIQHGRFERAHTGTLFLDEIGELPRSAQGKLLRVLENKEIDRIGGSRSIPIDVRIIAATNQSLQTLVEQDMFRRDLFYRLNVFPIHMPPLRDRKQDLPELVHFLAAKKQAELNMPNTGKIEEAELVCLLDYDWPGNIRELSNIIERAIITSQHQGKAQLRLRESFLHCLTKTVPAKPSLEKQSSVELVGCPTPFPSPSPFLPLEDVMRQHILTALRLSQGQIMGKQGAAALLGVNGYTLRKRMCKLGLDPKGRWDFLLNQAGE